MSRAFGEDPQDLDQTKNFSMKVIHIDNFQDENIEKTNPVQKKSDDFDLLMANLFSNSAPTTQRESAKTLEGSVLADIIEQKIQTKSLPLALRKRLMYQRSSEA